MIASKVTRETLETAAAEIGVRVNIRTLNTSGTRHSVKVNPGELPASVWQVSKRPRLCSVCGKCVTIIGETADGRLIGSCQDAAPAYRWANGRRWKDERGDGAYQRESVGYGTSGRRVAAVCWHGFRDFFRAVYRIEPDAVFRTAIATWNGSEYFEANFPASGRRNIGPRIAPVMMAEACRCPEKGFAR